MRIIHGDCLVFLPTLPDKSIHCCISSPPYFNLRDYQTGSWVGGDPECEHRKSNPAKSIASSGLNSPQTSGNIGHRHEGYRSVCRKCGAKRVDQQIGLEDKPDEYVAKLIEVFREVRRVLRDDGTVWLVLGDSYNNRAKVRRSSHRPGFDIWSDDEPWAQRAAKAGCRMSIKDGTYKEKDLLGIPWRVAFALQADGWYLRSAIIWAKPSVMPESVKDRPTNCYEHVFLLAKSERYFYDAVAIAEPSQNDGRRPGGHRYPGKWQRDTSPDQQDNFSHIDETRNCRNLWTIATNAYSGAHFATMPLALAERCVLAGTSERGCCAACGAPWRRVTEHTDEIDTSYKGNILNAGKTAEYQDNRSQQGTRYRRQIIGWQPSCRCNADVVPCTVLDMFGGTGTTAHAALEHGRNAILIELNADYIRLAEQRLAGYLHPEIKLAAD